MSSWNFICCQKEPDDGVAVIPEVDTNKHTLPDGLPMYTVTLSKKESESFGASFEGIDPDRPVIVSILPKSVLGRFVSAEVKNSSSRYPIVGSALVAVDGKASSCPDMVKALKKASGLFAATFKEPRVKTITIPEGKGLLGLQLRQTRDLGLFVTSCSESAASFGIQARDFIVAVDGEKNGPKLFELLQAVNGEKTSRSMLRSMLDVLQASKTQDASSFRGHQLEVWSYNEDARQGMVTITKADRPLGLELQPVTAGLQVVNVTGRAAEAGLRSMDIIVSINGVAKSPKDLFDCLREHCDLNLFISTPAS